MIHETKLIEPADVLAKHFSAELTTFIPYQHYHERVTQPLILEQSREIGLDVSSGQIDRILVVCRPLV